MALRSCRECGGQVSSRALVCPHCGDRFRLQRPPTFSESLRGLGRATLMFFGGVIVVMIFGINCTHYGEPPVGPAPPATSANSASANSASAVAAKPQGRHPGAAVAALVKEEDETEGTALYTDAYAPRTMQASIVMLIISDDGKQPQLLLKLQHNERTRLQVRKARFVVDARTYDELPGTWTLAEGSKTQEYMVLKVDASNMKLVREVAYGKNVSLTLEGKRQDKKRDLIIQEQVAMRKVLRAYEELGGT